MIYRYLLLGFFSPFLELGCLKFVLAILSLALLSLLLCQPVQQHTARFHKNFEMLLTVELLSMLRYYRNCTRVGTC